MSAKFVIAMLSAGLMGQLALADTIQISITGTADATDMGYNSGTSYTFNWMLNDSYTGSPIDFFGPGLNSWGAVTTLDPLLFTSVSGDGLSGTYSRPSAFEEFIDIYNLTPDSFDLSAANNDPGGSSMGLSVNGVEVEFISAGFIEIGEFTFPEAFVNPAVYWSNHLGTFTPTDGSVILLDENGGFMSFTATEVEVIPEPSTFGLMGLASAAFLFIRRRLKK